MGKPVPFNDLPPQVAADKLQDLQKTLELKYQLPDGWLGKVVKQSDLMQHADPMDMLLQAAEGEAQRLGSMPASAEPTAAAAAKPPALRPVPHEDLTPQQIEAAIGKPAEKKLEYDPSEGGSTFQVGPWDTGLQTPQWLDRGLSGMGKSFADVATGVKQLTGNMTQAEVDERAKHDAALMNTGMGKVGYVGGVAAQSLLPASMLAKGTGALAIAAPRAGAVLANPYTQAGALGTAFGAVQPVNSGDNRALNAAESGLFGMAGQGVMQGAKSLVYPAVKSTASAAGDLANKALDKFGIDLTAAQAGGNQTLANVSKVLNTLPFSGGSAKAAEQEKQWSRAVAKKIGEDTDDLPAALPAARKRLSDTYDKLSANHEAKLTPAHLQRLDDAINEFAPYDLSAGQSGVNALMTIGTKILDAAKSGTNEIDGATYKALRSKIGKVRQSTTDDNMKVALKEFQGTLDDAMRSNMPAAQQNEWRAADKQWGNLRTLEKIAPTTAGAPMDFRKLAATLNSNARGNAANKAAFVHGTGDQDLPELAKIGTTFLDKGSPASGSLNGMLSKLPKAALGGAELAGGGAGLYSLGSHHDDDSPMLGWGGTLAGMAALGAMGARGANSNWFARGVPSLAKAADAAEAAGAAKLPMGYLQAAQTAVPPTVSLPVEEQQP